MTLRLLGLGVRFCGAKIDVTGKAQIRDVVSNFDHLFQSEGKLHKQWNDTFIVMGDFLV